MTPSPQSRDQPLGAMLHEDLLRRLGAALWQASASDSLFLCRLEQRLLGSQVNRTEVRVVMRHARAVALHMNSARLDVPHGVPLPLEKLIASIKREQIDAPNERPARQL